MQENAVVLEREGPLGRGALEPGQAGRQLRRAVGLDEAADPRELVLGDGRVAGAHAVGQVLGHGRRAKVDVLEQRVRRVADLGRG